MHPTKTSKSSSAYFSPSNLHKFKAACGVYIEEGNSYQPGAFFWVNFVMYPHSQSSVSEISQIWREESRKI
jgi:phosphatidylserine decarboxylase